jgi:chorismate mutase
LEAKHLVALADLREELDQLDAELLRLLAERSRIIQRVIATKRAAALPPVDLERERTMLERANVISGSLGLDARVAGAVLRSVIDSFSMVQSEQLGKQ